MARLSQYHVRRASATDERALSGASEFKTVVGRGGLEPPTSALGTAQRCANESGAASDIRRVMWCARSQNAEVLVVVDLHIHDSNSASTEDRTSA